MCPTSFSDKGLELNMDTGTTRREFIETSDMVAPGFAMPVVAVPSSEIQTVLLHMGMNMWENWLAPGAKGSVGVRYTWNELFFDESVWRRTVITMRKTELPISRDWISGRLIRRRRLPGTGLLTI